jgi:hypothetical protein
MTLYRLFSRARSQVYSIRNSEADVPVVVMIATFDSNGDSSDERKFSFYCTRLYDSCVSVMSFNFLSFLLLPAYLHLRSSNTP